MSQTRGKKRKDVKRNHSKIEWSAVLTGKEFYERVIVFAILASFVLWLVTLLYEGADSLQLSIFFQRCADFLADTTNVVGYSAHRDTYHNMVYQGLQEKGYPPLAYVFFYFLSRLVDIEPYDANNYFRNMYMEPQFLIIVILLLIVQMIFVYEMFRSLKTGKDGMKRWTALAFILSAPMIYSIERGNTIIATMLLVGIYLFFFDSENKIYREAALISLALAAGLKMTPAVLGILLLYDKRWKEAVRAAIYGAIIFFVPFLFFEGGMSNVLQMLKNVSENLSTYSIKDGCTLVASVVHFVPDCSDTVVTGIKICTYVISLILLVCAPFFQKRWEKIAAVSTVLVVLPSHSGYYNILYLFPAFIAFLNETEHRRSDWIVLVALLCIMNDFQNDTLALYFDYHIGILLIVFVLLWKSLSFMWKTGKKWTTATARR